MSALFLGLDVGTQGTKGLLLDAEAARVVARAGVGYGLLEGLGPGAAEQHPETWIDAVRRVARELLAAPGVDPAAVAGVGVSGQQHGLVVLDARGAVVRPAKLWCDTTTAAEARELSAAYGRAVPTGFTAPKALWMARREPVAWRRVRAVMLPHDYVNLRLTGERSSEAGDASGTGWLDVHERTWRRDDAAVIDEALPAMLAPLLPPGEPAGALSRAGAELLAGVRPGTPVAAGGGDNMLSAVGSGATRPGVVVMSLGTSGTVFTYSAHPVLDPGGLIAPFCDSTGGWLPLLCVMNATGVTEEVRAAFAGGGRLDLDALTAQASAIPPGCDGVLWIPYLLGERVPDLPEASGVLTGLRPGSLSAPRLFRAALEGTSLNLAWGAERLTQLGVRLDEVRLVGGAARNPLWRRILADALDAPVRALLEPESAALGAALCALWTARRAHGERTLGAGAVAAPYVRCAEEVVEPTPEGVALYAGLGRRFRELVERLYPSGPPARGRDGDGAG